MMFQVFKGDAAATAAAAAAAAAAVQVPRPGPEASQYLQGMISSSTF
jgi:hypothetical protein